MYIKIWWVNEEYERMRNNSPDQRASTIPHSRGIEHKSIVWVVTSALEAGVQVMRKQERWCHSGRETQSHQVMMTVGVSACGFHKT